MANDHAQEQQPSDEGTPRVGIKPFKKSIDRKDFGSGRSKIESEDVLTPMGKLSISLTHEKDLNIIEGHPRAALGINNRGVLVEGTDHDFFNKGFYSLCCFLENPPIGPQPSLKFNLWTDNDRDHILSQLNVDIQEEHEPPGTDTMGDEPYHYLAMFWGPEQKELWVDPQEDVLKQINVSVESFDTGGEPS